jgi:TetR/AcrR family transcriptional regulator, cholesterol catabolism regulator
MSSSEAPATFTEAPRRALSLRQAETVRKLTDAAVEEVERVGFEALTVRSVAKRAGVAPATAYTYFASKEHLVTEAFWRLLSALPEPKVSANRTPATRVIQAFADMSELFVTRPELVSACTVAMVADDPDVMHLRDRFAYEIHRRFVLALGRDATTGVLEALDLAMAGVLLRAGTGHMSHADVPGKMAEVATLLLDKKR